MNRKSTFDENDRKAFEPTEKIALLATINEDGLPHISLISSLMAHGEREVIFGQFTEGLSKQHVEVNPRTGFLVLTVDKRLWCGQAVWRRKTHEGVEYEMYNNKPMYRYNSYFGIHTVHYMDLEWAAGPDPLPLGRIIPASILTTAGRGSLAGRIGEPVLSPWAQSLFNSLSGLKFLAFIDANGFPSLLPLIQCQAATDRRLIFSPLAYGDELQSLAAGSSASVFALNFSMESVLARGRFIGYSRRRMVKLGQIELDYVYNSMPPNHGQIYPTSLLEAVTHF